MRPNSPLERDIQRARSQAANLMDLVGEQLLGPGHAIRAVKASDPERQRLVQAMLDDEASWRGRDLGGAYLAFYCGRIAVPSCGGTPWKILYCAGADELGRRDLFDLREIDDGPVLARDLKQRGYSTCEISFSAPSASLQGSRHKLTSILELARVAREQGVREAEIRLAMRAFARFVSRKDIAALGVDLTALSWPNETREVWLESARMHQPLSPREGRLALGLQMVTTLERQMLRQVRRFGAAASAQAARRLLYVLHRTSGSRNKGAPRFNHSMRQG